MTENDKIFLNQIQYFREEKGDIERYIDFDLDRLMELSPKVALQYATYKLNKEILDTLIKDIFN